VDRELRKRLKKAIQEELAHPRDDLGKNIADVEFPIVVGYEDKSEIAYDKEELDNILDDIAPRGIPYSLDSLEDVEAKDRPVGASIEQYGEGTRKSLRRNLLRLIREQTEEQPNRLDSLLAYIEDLPGKLQDTHDSIEAEAMAVEDEGLVDDPELLELVDEALDILWTAVQKVSKITEQMSRDGLIGNK